jgi:asparagine synthase (glutamine-hydrolysing)
VQQWLSTPSIEKANREYGRYLHRRAIDRVVAPKVAWKPTTAMGQPRERVVGVENAVIDDARQQRAELHPIVDEVIDTSRLETQIAAAARGALDDDAQFQFRRNVMHLSWLNRWLWDR